MPLNRYQIRNEYSLANPELYKVVDKDDPEALLEGVAMAGLVGVLRQLGDLAEFAAEVFHDLHEEVMATAARGHNLIVRARQLEAEFPSIERTLLTQTSHTSFLYNSGVDWHPNLCMDQNLVTRGDVPRFVRDSHEECRGPPRLFLLDKFDVAGAGACLKRYTDPSFFKTVSMSSNGGKSATQREKKIRRVKKRAPRWRNGDTPESFPSSHAKLHQLFLEENLESGGNGPERRVKLKRRQFTGLFFDHDNKNSYMEKFVDMSPPGQKIATLTDECESGLEIVEIGTVSPIKESIKTEKDFSSSLEASKLEMTPSVDNFTESKLNEVIEDGEVEMHGLNRGSDTCRILKSVKSGEYFDIESSSQASVDGFASEIDNYLDAQATNESEVETDSECKRISHYLNVKPNVAEFYGSKRQRGPQSLSSDSQSIGNSTTSEVGNNFSRERENSSCSVSMSSMTESTKDLDAAIVAVPSFPTSKSDPDDISSDHHFASEGIPLIETEKHAVFDNGFAEADDYRKSTSNTSCLTGPNTINLPIEMEASQGENCLSSSNLDEEHSNFDNSGIFANQSGPKNNVERHLDNEACHDSGARAEAKHDLSNTLNDLVYMSQTESRKAESGSSSVEENSNELATAELDASSDVGQTLAHLPTSDAKHRETISPIDVNVDFFVSPAQHNSEGQYFAPESTKTLNILEQFSETNITGHGRLLDSALGDLPRSQEDHIPKELLNDLEAEVKASSASIVGLTEAVDTADWDHLEADRLGSLSPGDEPNCEIVSESADEKLVNISTTMVKPSMVPDLRGDHNRWQKLESEVHEAAPLDCHEAEASELCSGNNSTFNGGVVSVVENGQDSAMNAGIPEKASVFQNLTSSQQYQQEFVGNEAYLDESGTQAMLSDAASQHFSPIVEATNGLQGIESTFSCHIHPDKEKEFYADSLSHDDPNTTKCLQDIESKAKPLHADELSLQSINCPSPIQIPDFDRDRCTTPSHSYAQVSVDNFMQLSGESTSSSITNVLSGSSQCIQKVDNPGQLLCPSFPVLNMLSAEPPTSLEPPPLPPLPPMQWRLGRLQNPSTGVQRKMVQHTPGSVLPVAFPRSNVKSDIVATLPRTRVSDVSSENKTVGIGEDNHSYVNFETTVNVQNGDQFSESEESCNRSIDPPESGSTPEAHASENCLAVEEKSNTEIGSENGQPECMSQGAENEADNSVELSQSLTTHYDSGQQPGFTAFESGNILPSTHGFSINEDGNPNGSLQNKPSRPRNPLIDEVVAIDKSKLRKVGERTKPQAESKTEDVGSLLEQLQLRKVSDMVKQEVDRKPEETESPRLQLRKVVGRAHSTVGPKTEDRDSLLEQIRNKSFNLKPAATARPNFQFQGPRTNLKVAAILQKASNIRQAMAGSDEEDDADNWSDC